MLRKLGLKTMALTAGLAVAAPTIALARDRDDFRGHQVVRNERFDSHARYERRDWDDRGVRFQTNGRRFSFGVGINTAPAYRNGYSNGYYNGYGNNQVNGYYDNQGCFHPY
jgi:hypothetical protein